MKEYSTSGFKFITDPELKKLVSVFDIFCFIGIRKPKPNKYKSSLVLKENNKLNIVCSPTPPLKKTGVLFSFCHELDSLCITVYYSGHIYSKDAAKNDSTNDDMNDSTNDSTNQQWNNQHNGWILKRLKEKKESVSNTDTANTEEDMIQLILKK